MIEPVTADRALPLRLCQLVEEFGHLVVNGNIHLPLTQAELAARWSISRGSVQDFLRRHQETGAVVSRSPIVIRAQNGAPTLRLVSTTEMSQPDIIPSATANTTSSVNGSPSLAERCIDLLIDAAHQGDLELAHALKQAVLQSVAPPSQNLPAQIRANPRETAQNRAVEVKELEKKGFFSSSLHECAVAGTAHLSAQTRALVSKRLKGRSPSPDAKFTPSWDREAWPISAWSDNDKDAIRRYWDEHDLPKLSNDALTALQLWTPDRAATAIKILSRRSDTRNYSARIMDASIWGYHAFFDLNPGDTNSASTRTELSRLQTLASHLQAFSPELLIGHLESIVESPEDLEDRVGLAVYLGLIDASQVAALPFITWTSVEIDSLAHAVGQLLHP